MISGETIWLTGASSGIGRELARQLAQSGNRVIASARNEAALEQLALEFPLITPLVFDVSNRSSVAAVKIRLHKLTDRLDRIILNAGTCEYLDIHTPDWSMIARMHAVNCAGMANTLAAGFELLKKAPAPHIVGVELAGNQRAFPARGSLRCLESGGELFFAGVAHGPETIRYRRVGNAAGVCRYAAHAPQ